MVVFATAGYPRKFLTFRLEKLYYTLLSIYGFFNMVQ